MESNLSYLFVGYAAIWIILFAYITRLRQRERQLRQELEILQDRLEVNGPEADLSAPSPRDPQG
jgi:CcmD family protein